MTPGPIFFRRLRKQRSQGEMRGRAEYDTQERQEECYAELELICR